MIGFPSKRKKNDSVINSLVAQVTYFGISVFVTETFEVKKEEDNTI